jgi:hypothetical protein
VQDDTTRLVCGFGSREFKGGKGEYHFNWTQATYEGRVWYDELADDDNDVNFVLYRPDNAGATVFDSRGLQLEFDSSETVAHFNSSWWKNFWNAAQKERAVRDDDDASQQQKQQAHEAAAALLRRTDGTPVEGIVTGWLGLDCVHNCGSEIHPVFSLALHVKEDPNDDVWVFFVRNNGNEGYCSEGVLYAPQFNNFSFTLPWRLRSGPNPKIPLPVTDAYGSAELISFDGNAFSFSPDAVDVSTQAQPGTGIVINVASNVPVMSKPDPLVGYLKGEFWAEFELHFRWTGSQPLNALSAERRSAILDAQIPLQAKPSVVAQAEAEEGEPEKVDLRLSAADRKARRAILEKITPVKTYRLSVRTVAPGKPITPEVSRRKAQVAQPSAATILTGPDEARKQAQKQADEIVIKAHPELAH